ncbi:uncharacterized protein LOC141607368 [Silene latifolia]|uniref:uncharacterized protein LOC141607368 n=1 Tax=Silene latifolia TaxID=37657 RepID=UPI003D76E9EB
MGDLSSKTRFHVIEAKTSFKLLLGRPWKHENGVVASTLHQCLKYYRGGERKINGDAKPFTKADSFFADAKFFEENGTSSEFMPTTISLTGKGGKLKENTKEDVVTSHVKENDKQNIDNASKAYTPVISHKKQEMPQKSTSPVLRYIPKSRRKEGDSSFAECLTKRDLKDKSKPSPMIKQEWMVEVTTPLPSSNQMKFMRPPLVGFVCSSNQSSSDQNVGIFHSNAYKLLELFKQEGSFIETKAGLGYKSPTPVKISARRNITTTSSQHITVEEAEENEEEDIKTLKTSSVFDRISPPVQRAHPSIFDRLGRPSPTKNCPSVFTRLDKRGTNEVKSSTPPPCTRKKEEIPDDSEEVEADKAPETLEDEVQSTVDDLKEVNLGTGEDPRPMTELIPEIEKEVNKLIEAGFIREVRYPTWIANIVPVRKKNGQLRVCVNFRDLNDACPKDDFPFPVTELMINATTGHEALSFMNCIAGYNQIQMAPEDQEVTTFRTPKGIFCYKVMPFGLKNVRATYQ